MFNKLRARLALAYVLLAGVVLLAVTLYCLGMAERESARAAQSAFESGVNAILNKLQSDKTLSHAWLAQTEAGENQILLIEDGGAPLAFRGAYTPKTKRDVLLKRALASPAARSLSLPIGSLVPQTVFFQIIGDASERYLSAVSLLPASGKTPLRVTVLRDMTETDARVRRQRAAVLLGALAGLAALALIGWVYSGRTVKPARESHIRQVEFTAMASHELKTPLAVITASVDALHTAPDAASRDVLLSNLSGESLRMARLVDDLLLLSRSDAGALPMQREKVDLEGLLIECYERFLPVAAEKGIALSIRVPDTGLPAVPGDRERLYQALSILLDNALFYTPAGGHVRLGGDARAKNARIWVEDDGPGIPDDQKKKVFERFYRADAARNDRAHAGLGLSIAREIARLHGGRIELTDAPGHGARFTLALTIKF